MSLNYTKVASLQEIHPGNMLKIKQPQQDILLANIDGKIYAIADQCSHEDASLYNGALKGDCVECPLHSSRFSFKTGEPLEPPATEAIRTYKVKIEGDEIFIAL